MIKRILAAPALHFVLIGAAIFALNRGSLSDTPAVLDDESAAARYRIAIDRAKVDELRATFRKSVGRDATNEEERGMIRDYADQEMLYREARAGGLAKADRSVKWRLVQKMHFLDEGREDEDANTLYREALSLGLDRDDIVIRRLLIEKMRLLIKLNAVPSEPGRNILETFYQEHAEDYRQPARVSIHHVFLSSDKRGKRIDADADALLQDLREGSATVEEAIAMGDVFPLGHTIRSASQHHLGKLLGPNFAKATIDLQPSKQDASGWYGPIRSAYGMHLVWIDERSESYPAGLDAVHNQVKLRYLAERREEELKKAIGRMRERYSVVVENQDGVG